MKLFLTYKGKEIKEYDLNSEENQIKINKAKESDFIKEIKEIEFIYAKFLLSTIVQEVTSIDTMKYPMDSIYYENDDILKFELNEDDYIRVIRDIKIKSINLHWKKNA